MSPVSAYLALGMVGMGAQGETEEEFRELLGSNMPGVSQRLMERYPREQEGMTLAIANSAWVDRQLALEEKWIRGCHRLPVPRRTLALHRFLTFGKSSAPGGFFTFG